MSAYLIGMIFLTSFSPGRCWENYLPLSLQGVARPWCARRPWYCPGVPAGCEPVPEHIDNRWCGARAYCSPLFSWYWAYWSLHSDRYLAAPHQLSGSEECVCVCVCVQCVRDIINCFGYVVIGANTCSCVHTHCFWWWEL